MDTRKTIPRASLARIYFIDRQIASGKFPSAQDLADAYECGVATIHRDIEYMRDMLGAPIEYSGKERGWYYAAQTFRLPARFAAANDMLALGMAKSLLSLYRNTPLYESAKRLLDDITAPLSKNDASDADSPAWYENRIIVPPVASAPVDTALWDIVTAGLRENRVVTFEYKGVWDNDYKTRLVRPYQLLFDTGIWYLYGYSEERAAVRFFVLSRMRNAALTNETFILPRDFDYTVKNSGSYFGIFAGEKHHFRISFDTFSAQWVKARQWAADQKIEENENGLIIDFTSSQYYKVLSWLLSRGASARPIEPPQLVEEWKKHIVSLYEKVQKLFHPSLSD